MDIHLHRCRHSSGDLHGGKHCGCAQRAACLWCRTCPPHGQRHFVIPDELNVTALVLAFIDAGIGNYDAITEAMFPIIIRGSALSLAFWDCGPHIAGCENATDSVWVTLNSLASPAHGSTGQQFQLPSRSRPSPHSRPTLYGVTHPRARSGQQADCHSDSFSRRRSGWVGFWKYCSSRQLDCDTTAWTARGY